MYQENEIKNIGEALWHVNIKKKKREISFFLKHDLKGVLKYIGVEIWTHSQRRDRLY